jgi:hypothetical protein
MITDYQIVDGLKKRETKKKLGLVLVKTASSKNHKPKN